MICKFKVSLLLAGIFENIWNLCLKIYELDSPCFLTPPAMAWQATLKKTKITLNTLTDTDMLLMVEKNIWKRIFQAIYRYAKANNKYMKSYDKNK